MKKKIKIFLLGFGLIQFIACSNNATYSLEEETAKRIFSKHTDNKGDNIYGMGKASHKRGSLQKDVALAYAQSEIQKQIHTRIDDIINISNKEKNGNINTSIKSTLMHISKGNLRGAKIIDSYRGVSGTLYVLMKYNFKEYAKSIASLSIKPNFLSPKDRREIEKKEH